MLSLQKIKPLTKKFLEDSNFTWHTDPDNTPYISDEIVGVSQSEANAYYEAANELYDMFVAGAEYVIENNLFHELGIPFNLIDIIKDSWSNDVHWHLYGRFDFAGGLDGKPIKLLEFNADTPTSLFETTIIQWAMLKYNSMNEMEQFNDIYEAIKENFKRLITLSDDTSEFSKYYDGWKILFSSIAGSNEDEQTVKLLQNMADEAGFHTKFAYVDEVGFSDEEGIFLGDEGFEYWFKLIPWEEIAINEGELALILKNIIKNQKAIILNPAYTLLFQSKAMMKILWDLYPNHPLLLETSFEPLNKKQVAKPFLGREGANISILDENAKVIESKDGDYANQNKIYQEFYELNKDEKDQNYQAGLFFAYEGCGLGFRRGGNIIDNYSKFVGHFIKE
ncbi:glutathionylspermidine synthase subfamily protein [Campylobacter sputorum subsp. bubulus]|uniref:Glutathionylspermidine synthase subfamily protein n=1 Tax=Campylobacter sputorum subsp. sputorum TaxID=32024 RepID=A0A381DIP1_9BACT|nr:glutathionylspermidine synthase family protein [Campylobacter sputorum]ASM35578.1 glutathionylspermidine amidase / glutathionylspermidine synthetase [Campylobacter sputorum aubsp. sputorum RM3237]KAB0582689.1 glutathionylspermidine synthase family protein [Campylobacter sputorum subsp. sputorum]QEL05769.1 glutathionylspermidine amidase / glutathionylspermidine synthetase [Campylobacter sputorum subsp. sputorum]SUX08119.1 glutathionylspermidine synthase subfamily protein [Campylobacter sputor